MVIIFQKENGNTFTLFIIFIVKSLQKEQNSTNLLLWPPICRNKSASTSKWFNSLDTNSNLRSCFLHFLGLPMNKVWEAKPQNISLLKNVVESFFSLWSQILQSLHSKYFFPNWTIDGAHLWFDKNWLGRHKRRLLRTHRTSYIKTHCCFCSSFYLKNYLNFDTF